MVINMKMIRIKCIPSKGSETGAMIQGIPLNQACPDTQIVHERPVKLEQLIGHESIYEKTDELSVPDDQ